MNTFGNNTNNSKQLYSMYKTNKNNNGNTLSSQINQGQQLHNNTSNNALDIANSLLSSPIYQQFTNRDNTFYNKSHNNTS